MRVPRRLDPDRVVEQLPPLYRDRAGLSSREEAEETCAHVLARPRLLTGEDELGYLLLALGVPGGTLTSRLFRARDRVVGQLGESG